MTEWYERIREDVAKLRERAPGASPRAMEVLQELLARDMEPTNVRSPEPGCISYLFMPGDDVQITIDCYAPDKEDDDVVVGYSDGNGLVIVRCGPEAVRTFLNTGKVEP